MANPTMRDVADKAGVSLATVSHVINGTRFVSDETAEKVINAIKELSYVPNLAARRFKTGKQYMIGFIIPNISNTYFSTIIEEIETVISKKGYSLLLINTKESKKKELSAINTLASGMVDTLIIASTHENYNEISPFLPKDIPVVCVDRVLENNQSDSVFISSQYAIIEATRKLIDSSHKKIGLIAGSTTRIPNMERIKSFKKAALNFSFPEENMFIEYVDGKQPSIFHAADELYSKGVTGIIAANNLITLDLVRWSLNRRLSFKNDIEIIGFYTDEILPISLNASSIHMPTKSLGKLAGELVLNRLEDPEGPTVNHILHANFISR